MNSPRLTSPGSCYTRATAGKSNQTRPCTGCSHKAESHRALTTAETAARVLIHSRRRVRCQCTQVGSVGGSGFKGFTRTKASGDKKQQPSAGVPGGDKGGRFTPILSEQQRKRQTTSFTAAMKKMHLELLEEYDSG